MNKYRIVVIGIWLLMAGCSRQGSLHDYPITPVPFTQVTITDPFWKSRLDTNTHVTIPFALQQCETTGRLKNFRVAGGLEKGSFNSKYPFDDSDVYKIIEGAAYSLHNNPDPELENYLDTLISWIAAAQEPDGYLYTYRTILGDSAVEDWAGLHHWEKISQHSHELYNLGHLYEAAVAYYQATGKRNLLDIALKSADLVDHDFGPGKRVGYPGHQEIEIGLVKLYRLTGEERYLKLAKFFLDSRHGGDEYHQSHMPVTEQKEAVGHAVRACYMYSGMADVAALDGDTAYIQAIDRIWKDVVGTKLYITGGIGAAGDIEGFSTAYDLPNETAYCETCAGIANTLWNERLFLLHGEAKYIDVLERTMYNNVLSGVSLSGDRFFYPNPLESDGHYQRSQWFSCACCPSNICRFIPSVPGYIYAHDEASVYVNLFISSEAIINLDDNKLHVIQKSGLPWRGNVELTIDPERQTEFALKVRIPGWVSGNPVPSDLYRFEEAGVPAIKVAVNGESIPYEIEQGYAVLKRKWEEGDRVELSFPMDIHRIRANEKVYADSSLVALQRGPLVYCIEEADYNNDRFDAVDLPDNLSLKAEFDPSTLNSIMKIQSNPESVTNEPFMAIPYYAWAHRGPGKMQVWVRD